MADTTLRGKLWEPVQAYKVLITVIWPWIKAMVTAGHKLTYEIKADTRTLEQNAKFHAIKPRGWGQANCQQFTTKGKA